MIGWKRCTQYCGCIDEDACVRAPKNLPKSLPRMQEQRGRSASEKPVGEVCEAGWGQGYCQCRSTPVRWSQRLAGYPCYALKSPDYQNNP